MTTDTDKLKALALAATPGPWHAPGMGEIHAKTHEEIAHISYHTGDDEDMQCGTDADAAYIAAACPATVLALIAEVERLRADAERLDYLDKYAVIAKPGQPVRNAIDAARDQSGTKTPETRMDAAFEGGPSSADGSTANSNSPEFDGISSTAPAAGTEKDAKRYRVLREHVAPRDVSLSMTVPFTEIPPEQTIAERIDMLCDAAIEAKEPPCGS